MKRGDYLQFLEDNKKHVGMADWKITLIYKKIDKDVCAEVVTDMYEKTLDITLYKDFFSSDDARKCNILFHELTHARYTLYKLQVEDLTLKVEEQFINDMVRGFENVAKFKLGPQD